MGENKERVRKLTEWECLKLMGYTQEEVDRLKVQDDKGRPLFAMTNVFRYAGNSVVVDCFSAILSEIVEDMR